MADLEQGLSVHSDEHEEIDQEWDVVDAENEMAQLTVHFEEGGVGASLFFDDEEDREVKATRSTRDDDEERRKTERIIASLQDRNASMEARITELEHELSYADTARVNAEQRNAQLCATNAALVEETHMLTESLSSVKKAMEGVMNEKKSLEKNTSQLESFVEETITNSQSGYNFLCEARERVTDITKELMGLRNYLGGEVGGLVAEDPSLGFKGGVLQSVMSDLNVTLSIYKEVFDDVSTAVRHLKTTALARTEDLFPPIPPDSLGANSHGHSNKIALTNFTEGDVAMFFPTPKGDYVAFNIGTPHHYLSEESKALIGHDPHFKKVYVLGRIIIKEQKKAPAADAPYNLKPGTTYYEISVESIADMFPSSAMKGSNHQFRDGLAATTAPVSSKRGGRNGNK